MTKKLLQGNEAVVEAAIMAGVRFFAGYPITPSSEISEEFAGILPKLNGVFIQMEDEIASMACIIGASLAGAKTMTATSGPGFSLKQENLGYAIITETPCVIVNVQRGGPSTGLPTSPSQSDVMQARWGTHGDHQIIVYSPTTVQESFELTIRAINYSEKYRTPVILLMDEVVAHMREKILVPRADSVEIIDRTKASSESSQKPYENCINGVPQFTPAGTPSAYHITGLQHDESGEPSSNPVIVKRMMDRMSGKITSNISDICINRYDVSPDNELVLISFGITARAVEAAGIELRKAGYSVGWITVLTLWPFDPAIMAMVPENVSTILVPELNMGQYVDQVRLNKSDKQNVISITKYDGTIFTPSEIYSEVIDRMHHD